MARPILKWAGGKTQLLPEILKRLPARIGTYHEPFVGGGAVFFALAEEGRFERAILSDVNGQLVNVYAQLRDSPELLIGHLEALAKAHSRTQYYTVRDEFNHGRRDPASPPVLASLQAAYFIYLNKTCFNGLYRVNRRGDFNVPVGDYKNPTICDADNLRAASRALQGVELRRRDFGRACDAVNLTGCPVDCVYFDPPYVPLTKTARFTAYAGAFGEAEHGRLATRFTELVRAGVAVLLSNSDTPLVRKLYDGWQIDPIDARRSINSKGGSRGAVGEVLVRSWD